MNLFQNFVDEPAVSFRLSLDLAFSLVPNSSCRFAGFLCAFLSRYTTRHIGSGFLLSTSLNPSSSDLRRQNELKSSNFFVIYSFYNSISGFMRIQILVLRLVILQTKICLGDRKVVTLSKVDIKAVIGGFRSFQPNSEHCFYTAFSKIGWKIKKIDSKIFCSKGFFGFALFKGTRRKKTKK